MPEVREAHEIDQYYMNKIEAETTGCDYRKTILARISHQSRQKSSERGHRGALGLACEL